MFWVQIPVDACTLLGLKRRSFLFVIDTQKPQLILRFYRILQADLIPFADAIGAVRNNRYYAHFVHYESVWVRHKKDTSQEVFF